MRSWWIALVLVGFVIVPAPGERAAASCAAPVLETVGGSGHPPTVPRGSTITVRGRAFVKDCDDTGQGRGGFGCSSSQRRDPYGPLIGIRLELRQSGRHWTLGTADGHGDLGRVSWQVTVPAGAHPGRATLVAVHGGRPPTKLPITIGR